MNDKLFVTPELAKSLKDLGFDNVTCYGIYARQENFLEKTMSIQKECDLYFGGILAPMYQQAIDWLRDNFNLFYMDEVSSHEYSYRIYNTKTERMEDGGKLKPLGFDFNGDPYEAKIDGLTEIIKICNNLKK